MKPFALIRILLSAGFVLAGVPSSYASSLPAKTLSETALREKAQALVTSQTVRAICGGDRTLRELEQITFPTGALWVAHFTPSGHAVLTNSKPGGAVVRISNHDFVFPEKASPGYLLLEGIAGAAAEAVPTQEAAPETSASAPVSLLAISSYEHIEPITLTAWNQRGTLEWLPPREAPAGCTAVAYAQIMRALEWPVWVEETQSAKLGYALTYLGPSVLDDTYAIYPYTKINYDYITEAPYYVNDKGYETLENTKLVMLVDVFSGMRFSKGASGAFIHEAAENPWYERYVLLDNNDTNSGEAFDRYLEQFHQAAVEGIPICAEIQTVQGNHAIMVSGWTGSSGSEMVYFNFGWGKSDYQSDDGWYSLHTIPSTSRYHYIFHAYISRPKKTVQVAPLRKVSTQQPTLEWALPACYEKQAKAFTIDYTANDVVQQDTVTGTERSWTPKTPLTEGLTYTFIVTPQFTDATFEAIPSKPVSTRILASADMAPRTLTFASRSTVPHSDMAFKDGAFRSVTFNGTSVIHVTAPPSTTKLTIYSMRPESFPASAIKIYEKGGGLYDLVVDGSVLTKDREDNTRVLYTVCAEDVYGTITAKEMILHYHSFFPSEAYTTDPEPEPPVTPEPVTYTVQVTTIGNGTVTGSGTYEEGTQVTLTATPQAGYVFSKWTMGADTSTSATVSFTLTQNMNLTATFTRIETPNPEPGTGDEGEDPDPENPVDPGSDYTGTVYVTGAKTGATLYDADKPGDNSHSNLCWAYAFAGQITWYLDQYEGTGKTVPSTELRTIPEIVAALNKKVGNTSGDFSKGVYTYIQDLGYLLDVIDSRWKGISPTAYTSYYPNSEPQVFTSLEGFSELLFDALCKGPAFVQLLSSAESGHAVTLWGAEFESGKVKAIYIADSDDETVAYTRHEIELQSGRVCLKNYWAQKINALTFLWLPPGAEPVLPGAEPESDPDPEETIANLRDGKEIRVPHSWIRKYFPEHPDVDVPLTDDSDGDGFTDVEEYVIGTDPRDKLHYLKISAITFENEKPRFTVTPDTPSDVSTFTIYGCETLGGDWTEHTDAHSNHRFFRVRAKVKATSAQ